MDKSKSVYLAFFTILLFINSYSYFFIYVKIIGFLPWSHYSIDIITVLLFLLAIVPLTAYLSEMITKYSLNKGLGKNKNFKIFIAATIVLPIAFFSVIMVDKYSEKNLDEVLSYDTRNFESLLINFDMVIDQKEHAEELNELLNQYQVKLMKDREWDQDVSNEKGYSITIYSKGKPIMASIYENRLSFYNNGDYYHVINGPIDMDWFDKMYNKENQASSH